MPDITPTRLKIARHDGVATVSINHPPVNVLDATLMVELRRFLIDVAADGAIRVVVFESAVPDFFIAHVDMQLIDEPHAFDAIAREVPDGLNVFQALGELVRHLPQVTIAKVAGIARGGGAEFIAACDMAFGAIGRAGLAQCEALMGIVPSGGAMQYLSTRMSRARTLEVVLGAALFDAEEAAAYGWLNRALPADRFDSFVTELADNIANLPEGVAIAAKRVFPPADLMAGFAREEEEWGKLFARPVAEALIRGGLAAGAQTPAGEQRLEAMMRELEADDTNKVQVAGMGIRKGSIAAFLANATLLQDPHVSATDRERALADIAALTPALRAVGLFDVLAIRDAELRDFVDAQP